MLSDEQDIQLVNNLFKSIQSRMQSFKDVEKEFDNVMYKLQSIKDFQPVWNNFMRFESIIKNEPRYLGDLLNTLSSLIYVPMEEFEAKATKTGGENK